MKDGTLDFPDTAVRQVFLHFLQGKKYKHTPKQQGRSVLLMDEVDVFYDLQSHREPCPSVISFW